MHLSHNYACHQCQVAERDGRTLPITTPWRETMVAARQRQGFNQVPACCIDGNLLGDDWRQYHLAPLVRCWALPRNPY